MAQQRRLSIAVLVGVILLVTALAFFRYAQQAAAQSTSPHAVRLAADWPDYGTLTDLKTHADLVIHGTISKRISSTTSSVPTTVFTEQIQGDLYHRNGYAAGSTMEIVQTGGIANNTTYEVVDDPLFQPGEEVVLFVRHTDTPHVYVVLGGPQGRFEVANGTITPRDTTGKFQTLSGLTIEQFAQQVQNA